MNKMYCPVCGSEFEKTKTNEYKVNCVHLWGMSKEQKRLIRIAEEKVLK